MRNFRFQRCTRCGIDRDCNCSRDCDVIDVTSHFVVSPFPFLQVHFGRVTGGCESDVNEDSNEDLRILGNWDPKTQEKHHSAKLPMRTIRRKAGLFKADSMNWNPRTACEVPEELRNKAFPWVEGALATFTSMSLDCRTDAEKLAFAQNNRTARAFLESKQFTACPSI